MFRMHFLGSLAAALLLFAACGPKGAHLSEAVLYARYDATAGKLTTSANFFETTEKGDIRETELPEVRSANNLMQRVGSGTYQFDGPSKPLSPVVFEYTDFSKAKHSIELPLLSDFQWNVSSASATSGLTLTWSGNAIEASESLVLMLEDSLRHTVTCTLVGAINGNSVQVSARQLSGLKPGKWSMYVVHKQHLVKEQDGILHKMDSEFYTPVSAITVGE